ncbi:MAG: hypothetical protein ACFFD2_16570 [Promethearchaeota archaeon]
MNISYPLQSWWDDLKEEYQEKGVKLRLWQKSNLFKLLLKPQNVGIRIFFFQEINFSLDWFNQHIRSQFDYIGKKYLPGVHVPPDFMELWSKKILNIENKWTEIKEKLDTYQQLILNECNNIMNILQDLEEIFQRSKPNLINKMKQLINRELNGNNEDIKIIKSFLELLEESKFDEALKCKQLRRLRFFDLTNLFKDIIKEIEEKNNRKNILHNTIKDKFNLIQKKINNILSSFSYFEQFFYNFQGRMEEGSVLLDEAGTGKTHSICGLADKLNKIGNPCILLFGNQIGYEGLGNSFKNLLEVRKSIRLIEIIKALELAARTYKKRIPIFIDGLNESLNLALCKNEIRTFFNLIKSSPWLIIILTCRRSYKKEVVPDEILDSAFPLPPIQVDNQELIIKYFKYYKISPQTRFFFHHIFQNPIYVRFFCEVYGDPKAISPIKVEISFHNIYYLFEKFMKKISKDLYFSRKLDRDPEENVIRKSLIKISNWMFKENSSSIEISIAKELVDSSKNWSSNILNVILNEDLFITRKILGSKDEIFFTFELFGDYLISLSFIQEIFGSKFDKILKNKSKTVEHIFDKSKFLNTLLKHPRYNNILECLAIIFPERYNLHLYNIFPNSKIIQKIEELSLFNLSFSVIDKERIDWFTKRFLDNTNHRRKMILNHFKYNLSNISHPINANYLDLLLRKFKMVDRDLFWTEWVRNNGLLLVEALQIFEQLLKSTDFDKNIAFLMANFCKWLLTTTYLGLRDKTTYILYLFGKRFPELFVDLIESSMDINDPYVIERMLAALYGIVMTHLPSPLVDRIAKLTYNSFFKKDAPFSTTHLLLREYAYRIIEYAIITNPSLFTKEEIDLTKPPFKRGGIRDWKIDSAVKAELTSDGDASSFGYGPIHMDFAKYIIGPISRRGTYQLPNFPTLKESIGMIIWRMKQYGYSEGKFQNIDKFIMEINESRIYSGPDPNLGILKRYGKKYQWIAFFELAGYYADVYEPDEEDFDNLRGRTSLVNIDPSFPAPPKQIEIINDDFIGDRGQNFEDWIDAAKVPDFLRYIKIKELDSDKNHWILLYSDILQRDKKYNRRIGINISSYLIKRDKRKSFFEEIKKIKDRKNVHLPRLSRGYNTFQGEIPWCETFPYQKPKYIKLVFSKPIKKLKTILIENGKEITFPYYIVRDLLEKNLNELNALGLEKRTIEVDAFEPTIKEFEVIVPIQEFHWEFTRNQINPGLNVTVLNKQIIECLNLKSNPQTFNLFDKFGQISTQSFQWGYDWHKSEALFFRKDLLEKYMEQKGLEFFWIIQIEKLFISEDQAKRKELANKDKYRNIMFRILIYDKI